MTGVVARTIWAHPRNNLAKRCLSAAPGDPMGRYHVDLDERDAEVFSFAWDADDGEPAIVVDRRSGLVVRLWRDDCGAGCRCAASVGVWPADTIPTSRVL